MGDDQEPRKDEDVVETNGAFALGDKLLVEAKPALLRRWGAYWASRRSQDKSLEKALAAPEAGADRRLLPAR